MAFIFFSTIRALKKESLASKKEKKNKRKDSVSDEIEDTSDEEEDFVDDDFDNDEEFANAMNEELSDEELSDAEGINDVFVNGGPTAKSKKTQNKEDMSALFASAEEVFILSLFLASDDRRRHLFTLYLFKFDDMLADSANFESKGVGFLANRDNSDVKQLKWEMSRSIDKRKNFRNKFTKNEKTKNFKQFNKKASLRKKKQLKLPSKNRKKSKK